MKKNKKSNKLTFIINEKELYNTDTVLSKIIADVLIRYKSTHQSIPFTYKKHVVSDKKYKWNKKNSYSAKRWEWIVDEMIYSYSNCTDKNTDQSRLKHGRKLFYAYFDHLLS